MILSDLWIAAGVGLTLGAAIAPAVAGLTLLEFRRVQRRVNTDDTISRVITIEDFPKFASQTLDWHAISGLVLKGMVFLFVATWLSIFVGRGLLNHPYWAAL